MATETTTGMVEERQAVERLFAIRDLSAPVQYGLVVAAGMAALAFFFGNALKTAFASLGVEETVTSVLALMLVIALPYTALIASTSRVRHLRKVDKRRALFTTWVAAAVVFVAVTAGQFVFKRGPFAPSPTLGFTATQTESGIVVESLAPGGTAEEAGLQTGDVITAIRRDEVTKQQLLQRVSQAEEGDPFRLRFLRDGEEMQLTVRVALSTQISLTELGTGAAVALVFATVVLFWPAGWTPYMILLVLLSPVMTGYIWVIIATFSFRTEGMLPLDGQGNVGGFTLRNWTSLLGGNIAGLQFNIWPVFFNSLMIAVVMTVVILLVSSMAGYALSRMQFPGRRFFLSFTLVLHGFPAVTLLIPIFLVLLNLGNIPIIGRLVGFNTVGGIALVMVAFQLPLGVWLMKGFFDNIPWDMERSALIDGASRWRTYWEILLPQIRPGILALGIFAFISGWNAYIIPATYSIGAGANNLPVFLNELIDETAPVDWNQVAAVGLFQLIPVFVFFVFAQEYLLNIYAGGTKGTT